MTVSGAAAEASPLTLSPVENVIAPAVTALMVNECPPAVPLAADPPITTLCPTANPSPSQLPPSVRTSRPPDPPLPAAKYAATDSCAPVAWNVDGTKLLTRCA